MNTDALYAIFDDWFINRQGERDSVPQDTIEIKLPTTDARAKVSSCNLAEISDLAGRIYHHRRIRDEVFSERDLFGEPVWDMLLDIFMAEVDGKNLSVTSVCVGSCVAETTALRWLKIMEVKGLICREADAKDGRRSFIRLTDDGRGKLKHYFNRIANL